MSETIIDKPIDETKSKIRGRPQKHKPEEVEAINKERQKQYREQRKLEKLKKKTPEEIINEIKELKTSAQTIMNKLKLLIQVTDEMCVNE